MAVDEPSGYEGAALDLVAQFTSFKRARDEEEGEEKRCIDILTCLHFSVLFREDFAQLARLALARSTCMQPSGLCVVRLVSWLLSYKPSQSVDASHAEMIEVKADCCVQ